MKTRRRFVIFCLIFLFSVAGCAGPQSNQKTSSPSAANQTSPQVIQRVPVERKEIIKNAETAQVPLSKEGKQTEGPALPSSAEKPPASSPPASSPPVASPPALPSPAVTPEKPGPPAAAAPVRTRQGGFVFNFDNADLYAVIRTVADVLKISYTIDPKVTGVVNIHTSGAIADEDIYPIFLSILKMNNATAVKRGPIYEIVPFGEGKKLPTSAEERKRLTGEDRFVIEIIKPRYIPIAELEKVIKPFVSDEKEVISFSQNNILIISDLASNIRKLREIINLLDIDIFTDMFIRIFPVFNSDVNEVAKELGSIFNAFGISSKEAKGGGITFTPVSRSNSLLVVSSMPGIMEKVENWVRELDKPPAEESKMWVHVYYVQNAKAKDLAEVLKTVYAKGKEVKPRAEEAKPSTPAPTPTRPTRPGEPARPAAKPAASTSEATGVAEGEINIVVDETNNALVIRALYRDYKAIMDTIKKLDIYPKQVLIEAMLAQITLDDSTKFGIEWARFVTSNPPNAQEVTGVQTPPVAPFLTPYAGGIRYSIVELGGRVAAAISAAASDNRANVISSPHIIASNNKEAKIQVGKSQPILTNTYTTPTITGDTTTASSIVTGTIEYKDIGVILTVTPRISDAGLITLEIQVEKSDVNVSAQPLGNLSNVPVFDKKTASTTLSVVEGQMIVIGGLIEDTKSVGKAGIPYLSRIPILGALFGTQNYATTKTELIILMTPHIITDHRQSRTVTEEFREKVEGVRREFERREKTKNK